MSAPLIELRNAHVSLLYKGQKNTILQGVDCFLHEGRHCAILGANGAGKSTLLKLLRGEIWPDKNEQDSEKAPPITWHVNAQAETSPIMGRKLTALVSAAGQERYVRHEWRLHGEDILLTAFSDSELLFFIPEQKQKEAVHAMAKKLSCLHLLQQEACTLSQGQLRLLMLGRALLREPKVLLLDEYMEGLDAPSRELLLKALEDCGATLVFTGHRTCSVPAWVQDIYTLQGGKLIKVPNVVGAEANTVAHMQVSSEQKKPCPLTEKDTTQPVRIHIDKATVFIDRKALLHDISWTWRQGEHWYLCGANGAGKSTFLRLLAGYEHPAFGGSIKRYDLTQPHAPKLLQDQESIGRAVRLISDKEQMSYAYDVSGLEMVLSGLEQSQGLYRDYSEAEQASAHALLKECRLSHLAQRSIRTLSTGQLRRLLLARALMGSPQILLLDELFSGLDGASYTHMRDLLEKMSPRVGLLMVSHYGEDRLSCMQHEAHMQEGRLRLTP